MKTDLFQSCGHCWVFQICWHIECSTFTASSFRIWNTSTGIPSPPLAVFTVMLPKAHLTSDSRMSGSRWVITPSWLSGSWKSVLYSYSVYSCHLFLLFSASVRSIPFLSFIEPICMKCSLGVSNFLEEISSLSHSIVEWTVWKRHDISCHNSKNWPQGNENWRWLYLKQSEWCWSEHQWLISRWPSELTILILHVAPSLSL